MLRIRRAPLEAMMIREFKVGDAASIERLLSSSSSFDPEGPLSVDCATDAAIQEWYGSDDGCFLVATPSSYGNDDIVGTAGLVVGTTISYQATGASLSTPAICTGAVRRVTGSTTAICQQLLEALEIRAAGQGVDELIVLAYPANPTPTTAVQELSNTTVVQRPTSHLLETLGYQRSASQLRGTDVIQYAKQLTAGSQQQEWEQIQVSKESMNPKATDNLKIDKLAVTLIAGVLVVLLIAVGGAPK